jgi:hypothetical protein
MASRHEWTEVRDGREMTAGGVVYRAAPGGSSKFFLAWADDEVLGQGATLREAQALCEREAARRGNQK